MLKRNRCGEVVIDVGLKEFYSDSNDNNVNNLRIIQYFFNNYTMNLNGGENDGSKYAYRCVGFQKVNL